MFWSKKVENHVSEKAWILHFEVACTDKEFNIYLYWKFYDIEEMKAAKSGIAHHFRFETPSASFEFLDQNLPDGVKIIRYDLWSEEDTVENIRNYKP